jgi:hypothetical protein
MTIITGSLTLYPQNPTMNFSLTPEHEMTRQMVREFAEREVAPVIKEYGHAQKINPHAVNCRHIKRKRSRLLYTMHHASRITLGGVSCTS